MPKIFNFLKNTHKAGDPIRYIPGPDDANKIANILQDIEGVGCQILKPKEANGRGWKIVVGDSDGTPPGAYTPPWGAAPLKRLFELQALTTTNFEISTTQTTSKAVGQPGRDKIVTVTAGTGMTLDGNHWQASAALAAASYIYLQVTSNTNADIIRATTLPSMATSADDTIPLYYFAWASSEIDVPNSIDLRNNYHMLPDRQTGTQYQGLFLDSNLLPAWDWPRFHS